METTTPGAVTLAKLSPPHRLHLHNKFHHQEAESKALHFTAEHSETLFIILRHFSDFVIGVIVRRCVCICTCVYMCTFPDTEA